MLNGFSCDEYFLICDYKSKDETSGLSSGVVAKCEHWPGGVAALMPISNVSKTFPVAGELIFAERVKNKHCN